MNVITTGGPEVAYHMEGRNHITVRQLLAPIEQTANLCKMIFLPPFTVHGTHGITLEEITRYKDDYHELILALSEGRVEIDTARKLNRINDPAVHIIHQFES